MCQMQNTPQPSGSLTCSWCRWQLPSYAQLKEHEEFHQFIEDLIANDSSDTTNTDYSACNGESNKKSDDMCDKDRTPLDTVIDIVQYGGGKEYEDLPYIFNKKGQNLI